MLLVAFLLINNKARMGKQQAKEVHHLTYVSYVGQKRCSTRPNRQPDCQLSTLTVLQPALTEIRQVEPEEPPEDWLGFSFFTTTCCGNCLLFSIPALILSYLTKDAIEKG